MEIGRKLFWLSFALLSSVLGDVSSLQGQSTAQYALQLSTAVQPDPPQITLLWPAVDETTGFTIYRKSKDDTVWGGSVAVLAGSAVSYVDTNVVAGGSYEYHVWRTTPKYESHGYVYAGIEAPLTDTRGKVLLIVDSTFTESLSAELARLQQDLVGDGWTVLRHDVPRQAVEAANPDSSLWTTRSNEVASLKRLIQADYLADRANVQAVFLFGHVPVPYSGALAPDQHPDHLGAWPADAFYGDMDGTWTDSALNTSSAADPRNRNVPGDGKFDQTTLPGRIALEVGRVDMANLPLFPIGEAELLRQYLNKDHNFRHKTVTALARGLVDDELGVLYGEVPSINGWGNFAALFGSSDVVAGHWLSVLPREDYLWGYGCGNGTYTRAASVVDSSNFLVYDTRVIFTMLFGSYFGDWDTENNLLRSQLATASYTLASCWAGRPTWYVHHMALGETIGYSTRLTQNNAGLYQPGKPRNPIEIFPTDERSGLHQVHVALMGDPTLRLHVVAPPTSLVALVNDAGTVALAWTPSPDIIQGYHVYRAASADGPYARLSSEPIGGTVYSDPAPSADRFYMVRAVRLESSGSGTYDNASQGAFAELPFSPVTPDANKWVSRGSATWKITDATGTAGADPGWDSLTLDGVLQVTATADDPFTVRIFSLTADRTSGLPAHFNNNLSYSWPLVTTSAVILGFDPAKVRLQTSDFAGDLGGGTFRLELSEDRRAINLVFVPNRPPAASPVILYRPLDTPLTVPIADLLATFTSDADGDARALVQVGSSTNGTVIATDRTSLKFQFTSNLPETVSYWVQDVRNYRAGDTARTASSTITIFTIPSLLQFSAYHAIEIEWQGDVGTSYQLQSRGESDTEWKNVGAPFLGTGNKTSFFQRTSSGAQFFRIVTLK